MTTAITLLDGGMGQELIRRSSAAKPHPLWSLQVMMDEPELVANVHRDFCLAGARVICLNTYSVTRHRLQMGSALPDLPELLKHAGDLARAGIQASGLSGIDIVASLPPLTASYLQQSPLSPEQMKDEYKELMELQRYHVDGFLAETLSSIAEGQAVLLAAQEADTGVHLAFTVQDEDGTRLRSGELLEDALRVCVPLKPLSIILNCSVPEAIDQGLPLLAVATKTFGAYANGFHSITALKPGGTVDVLSAREELTPAVYTEMALQWLDLGASILGGCCEVGPAHIEALAAGIVGRGRELSGLPAAP
ncbi:homocysteine S-methyltransferase family protein [Luminiphilus sp.]|nr:homocysteine S-methyltransferase family protein [Luminiphilus sp.]MDC3405847.1 homocysteine S-methyltransferase family protein [Luminiphilus sp.]